MKNLFLLLTILCHSTLAINLSPTNSLTLFGGDPIYSPNNKVGVAVDPFGWIDYTLTTQKTNDIYNITKEWQSQNVACLSYYALSTIESDARLDPWANAAKEIDLNGNTNSTFVITQPTFRNYLTDSAKQAIDLGSTYFVLDNAAPAVISTLSFDENALSDFREYLSNNYSQAELEAIGVTNVSTFNYRDRLISDGYTDTQSVRNNEPTNELFKVWTDNMYWIERSFFSNWTVNCKNYALSNYTRNIFFGANRYIGTKQWRNLDLFDYSVAETFIASLGYPNRSIAMTYKTAETFDKRFWSWNFPANESSLNGGHSYLHETQLSKIWCAETYAFGGLAQIAIDHPAYINNNERLTLTVPYHSFVQSHPDCFNQESKGEFALLYSEDNELLNAGGAIKPFRASAYLFGSIQRPYDVLFGASPNVRNGEEKLTLEDLNKYSAVLLPNVNYMPQRQITLLTNYVDAGGTIIGIGNIAKYNENGTDVSSSRTFDNNFGSDKVTIFGNGRYISFGNDFLTPYYDALLTNALNFTFDESAINSYRSTFTNTIDEYLVREISVSNFNPKIIINRYSTTNNSKIFHFINKNIYMADGAENEVISPVTNAVLTVNMPTNYNVSTVNVEFSSPENPAPLAISFSTNVVGNLIIQLPEFEVWGVLKIGEVMEIIPSQNLPPNSTFDFTDTGGHRPDTLNTNNEFEYTYWYWQKPVAYPVFMANDDHLVTNLAIHYRFSTDYVSWSDWSVATNLPLNTAEFRATNIFDFPNGSGHYQLEAQATDNSGQTEMIIPFGQSGYGYDAVPPEPMTGLLESHGVKSDYWTTITNIVFNWDWLTDALSGIGPQIHLRIVDEGYTTYASEYLGHQTNEWAPSLTNLSIGNKYFFLYRAEDNAANWNSEMRVFELWYGTAAVDDPTNMSAFAGNEQITVQWTNPTNLDYKNMVVLFRETTPPYQNWIHFEDTIDKTVSSSTIHGLENGKAYQIQLVAKNTSNEEGNGVTVPGTYSPESNSSNVTLFINSQADMNIPNNGLHIFTNGTQVTCSITNTIVQDDFAHRFVYKERIGTGSVPSGFTTSSTFNISVNSTCIWEWAEEVLLDVEISGYGSIDIGGDTWCNVGTNLILTAIPSNNCTFVCWEINFPPQTNFDSSLSITMHGPNFVKANFTPEPIIISQILFLLLFKLFACKTNSYNH